MAIHSIKLSINLSRRSVVNVVAVAWIFIASYLTTSKWSPAFLNADILLNSVMSLQNLTLYYWGQNRLLNILPFIVSGFSDPVHNLLAILFVSSASLYAFFWSIVKIISNTTSQSEWNSLKVFVILSSLFLMIFSDFAISEMALGHIEYSLPALLVSLAFYLVWYMSFSWSLLIILAGTLLFTAIGINPSVILLVLFIVVAMIFKRKKVLLIDFSLVLVAMTSFVFWGYVSRHYGDSSYGDFDFLRLPSGLAATIAGLSEILKLKTIFAGLLILFCYRKFGSPAPPVDLKVGCHDYRYAVLAILIFSSAWLILFSASTWVEANRYSWRYFTFIIFGCLVILSVEIFDLIRSMRKVVSWVFVIITLIGGITSAYSFPVAVSNFAVFNRVNSLIPNPAGLYAGDYWLAWPAVFRDLSRGQSAFGLAFRGEGNKTKALQYIDDQIKDSGYFSTYCLNDAPANCVGQIQNIVGPIKVIEEIPRGVGAVELKLVFDRT